MTKSGIIYRFKCDRLECDKEYIGEVKRTPKSPLPLSMTIATPLVTLPTSTTSV